MVRFGEDRTALKFGSQKINLHQEDSMIEPRAASPATGSADVCFITEKSLQDAVNHLELHGIEIEIGPINRTGAGGKIISLYIRDPDHNLIELSNDLQALWVDVGGIRIENRPWTGLLVIWSPEDFKSVLLRRPWAMDIPLRCSPSNV
ncbi:VOC family protein [Lacicoccus alkaliphilus]|uniref:VOC family protein n=1 Tax=Lacicoccus alkaliphilus TaxID=148453 RepID=UPI0011603747